MKASMQAVSLADPAGKEPVAKMLGELLREGGLLGLVFGLLDGLIERMRVASSGLPAAHAPPTSWYVWTLLLSAVIITLGIVVERRR